DLSISENPLPAVPRQFFAASVRPVPYGFPRKAQAASEPSAIFPGHPVDESLVEGYPEPARFSTAGAISAVYRGGRVELKIDPVDQPRFLVLNEMYHPRWRAFAGDS